MTLVFWFPIRNLPYWGDSATYTIRVARYYFENNFNSLFIPPDFHITVMARIHIFSFLLALSWKIFGQSLFISHLFYLFFVLLAVIFTYLLGKKIAYFEDELTNNLVGFSAALLLLFCPLFLAQVGIIYLEIPVTAFALMTVYFFLERKIWSYLISAILMVFTKETSVVIILAILSTISAIFFLNYFSKKQLNWRQFSKKITFYSIPLFLLIIWYGVNKIKFGWAIVMSPLINSPFVGGPPTESFFSLWSFKFKLIFSSFFLGQWRNLISLVILLVILFFSLGLSGIKRKLKFKEISLLLLIVVFVPLLFCALELLRDYSQLSYSGFMKRHIIFGLPFLFIIFGYLAGYVLQKKKIIFVILTAIILVLFSLEWDNHQKIDEFSDCPLEENQEYLGVIKIGKQTAAFVEKNYPSAVVYASHPINYMLSEPLNGYVSEGINTKNWFQYYKEKGETDLIILHPFSRSNKYYFEIIEKAKSQLIKRFEYNGKWVEIYKNPDL